MAGTQRIHLDLRRFMEASVPATLAPHHEVRQVAAGTALVEPELPQAGVTRAVDEVAPVHVVHVPAWARADEAGGDDGAAIEAPLVVECLAMR